MRLLMEIAKGIGLICVLFSSVAARGLTLSVAPNSVEVSSSGNIDVTIGTPGAGPVKLQLVVDLNANGSADGTEPTVHQIELADGVRAAVGGVRNPNVTSDEDGAVNGTIQARVRLAQFPELGRLAGKYIWRATGSDGSSQDQPFTVTQPETGQQISGTVTSNGSAVAYAGVVVLDATADDGEPVGGAYADANGNYTVKVATGSYLVLPTRIGLVTRFEDAPMVEVSASEQATADLTLVASTRLINGFVRKAGSGTAVAGIQVFGESEDGEALALGVTGSNGQFSLPALAGTWLVGILERQVSAYGLIRPADDETVSTSAGNAENVVMELNEPTALIHGTLKSSDNQPLAGVEVRAWKSPVQAEGLTDQEGKFVVGVSAGTWFLGVDEEELQALGLFVSGSSVTITDGQVVETNMVAARLNATISGRVIDANGNGIADVQLVVQPEQGGSSIYPTTGADGSFEAAVYGGTWRIALECDDALLRGYLNASTNVTVAVNGSASGVVLRVASATRQITGTVKDENTNAVTGLQVDAWANVNGVNYFVGCVETDAQGAFVLGVLPGTWNVSLRAFELEQRGYEAAQTQQSTVSNGSTVVNFTVQRPQPVQLSSGRLLGNGQFAFEVSGRVGAIYAVEGSSTLNGWVLVSTQTATTGIFTIAVNESAQTHRFYRVRRL